MSRRRRFVVASAVAICAVLQAMPGIAAVAPAAGDGVPAASRIDDYLDALSDEMAIPGLAVALMEGDRTLYRRTAGRDGDGRPITATTPFLIGSVAKSMTSALVVRQVRAGALRLSDSIGTHLPWIGYPEATVDELLTHRAGYTASDGLAVAERFDNSPGAMRRAAADLTHSGTRGDYEYSDAHYLVLGALVEKLAGRPFGHVLRDELLAPLGMDHTSATAGGAAGLPPGHRYWWGHPRTYDPGFDESGSSYGYVASTLDDMATYARAQSGGFPAILDAGLRSEMHTPRVPSGSDGYGFGWRISGTGPNQIVHHTGATPGYFAHVLLAPNDRSIVVLANGYSEANAPALAATAVDLLAILDGDSPRPRDGDAAMTALPWVLSMVAVLGVGTASVAWWRPRRRVLRWTLGGASILICGVLVAAPSVLGSSFRQLWIWAPDSALMLATSLCAWAIAAAAFVVRTPPDGQPSSSIAARIAAGSVRVV